MDSCLVDQKPCPARKEIQPPFNFSGGRNKNKKKKIKRTCSGHPTTGIEAWITLVELP